MLLATVVVIITCLAVANATQTITTPNAAFISYNLAAGVNSATITPVTNKGMLVIGCCTTRADLGVSQVSLLHFPASNLSGAGMQWIGLETNTILSKRGSPRKSSQHGLSDAN
jgi:hypothetical protein